MRWLNRLRPKSESRESPAPRRPLSRRARNLRQAALVVVAIGAIGGLAQTKWPGVLTSTTAAAVEAQFGKAGFRVKRIYLKGRRNESTSRIRKALQVRTGEPILSVRLEPARKRLEELPYVRHASVQRHFPNILVVSIVERQPMALWERGGEKVLIDEEGDVITVQRAGSRDDLLVLSGLDAPQHGADLLAMLSKEPELRKHVVAASRVAGRRWDIQLSNNVRISLPEHDSLAAWRKLARIERRHRLLNKNLLSIDLRLPDQFIVRTRGGRTPAGSGSTRLKGRTT